MKSEKLQINALTLHLIAMFCMLLDHMWATVVAGHMWMTFVGRIALPIFAFMIVEGYFHTHDFKKYLQRLLVFALLSEIPFNLMMGGRLAEPFHQNVIWTFVISLLCIRGMEKVRHGARKPVLKVLACVGIAVLACAAAMIGMTDYSIHGVLTVLVFYFFRGRTWPKLLGQLAGLYLINFVIIQNMDIPLMLLGHEFFFPTQGFAILALIPIWLYRGKQGPHGKWIQYACYAFYPVHILVLSLLALAGF